MNKKSILRMQLNSINEKVKDPTLLEAEAIIHGFEVSGNSQVISQEVCKENMNTLIGKRVVCKYISASRNNGIDAITDHEAYMSLDRDGNEEMHTDTIAIGFIKDVYIKEYISEDGSSKDALFAKIYIWNDEKYSDVVGLLKEWLDRGIKIKMSVEYMYKNYKVINGVEYILSPIIYTAHALLNSEARGEYDVVDPAYEEAQLLSFNDKKLWNKAVAQLINKEVNVVALNEKDVLVEDEKVEESVEENITMNEEIVEETENVEDSFIEEKNTNDSEDIDSDVEEASVEEEKKETVSIEPNIEEELILANNTILTNNERIKELESQLETAMNTIKIHEDKELENTLNSKREEYKEKFNAVGLGESFETEEVQGLIKCSLNDAGSELKLTKMLIETIKVEEKPHIVKEMCSKSKELIKPASQSFEDRYGEL